MSPDRRPGARGLVLGLVVVVGVLAAVAAWALIPRSLGPVTVEQVQRLSAGAPDGGHEPDYLATPERIAVTFAVPKDLAAARARLHLGYVAARLAACDHPAAATMQMVTQRAGYMADYGRVRRLGADPAGRVRYRAVFDNALTETIDHQARRSPALGRSRGLCFSLYGASMWFGQARSASVPLDIPG